MIFGGIIISIVLRDEWRSALKLSRPYALEIFASWNTQENMKTNALHTFFRLNFTDWEVCYIIAIRSENMQFQWTSAMSAIQVIKTKHLLWP